MARASLMTEFDVAVRACSAAVRVDTDEQEDAISAIAAVCRTASWYMRVWDAATGVQTYNSVLTHSSTQTTPDAPVSALKALASFLAEPPLLKEEHDADTVPNVMVVRNFHLCLGSERHSIASVIQHIIRDKIVDCAAYKDERTGVASLCKNRHIDSTYDTAKFIVVLMPAEQLMPPELRPLFQVITHELPEVEELDSIFQAVISDKDAARFTTKQRRDICKQALGLTRLQAESTFAIVVSRNKKDPDLAEKLPRLVGDEKAKILNNEGLVEIYQGEETFDDIVGHDGLKTILQELLAPDKHDPDNTELRSRGIALVGPPRTGKSLTAKAAGNMTGRITVMANIGNLMGGLVGDTEAKTRKFFQTLRALAPVICVID